METAYLPSYIFAAIAVVALIVTLVLILKLIFAKKEKRIKMINTTYAAVVSALLVPVLAGMAIISFPIILVPPPPVENMPNIIGLSYAECKENYSDKFELVVEEELYSSEYPEGAIIEQKPAEDSEYIVGRTTVKCKRSRGVRMVHVPNVIGLDFEDVKEILEEKEQFTVGFVSEYSDDVPKGKVIATDPPAGEKVAYGSAVKVTVSGGKEPDVTDSTEWYEELY